MPLQKSSPAARLSANHEHEKVAFHIGDRVALDIEVEVSSAGLLSIGALVAMTLLSTAVLVRAAGAGARVGPASKSS